MTKATETRTGRIRLRTLSIAVTCSLALGLSLVAVAPATAQDFTTLHSFNGTNGTFPAAGLVLGRDGSFYGTTSTGGASCDQVQNGGCGTVFKTTPGGTLTTLYSFCQGSATCPDGEGPEGGLVLGKDGDFYGVAGGFGANGGGGTVFKITPEGTLTTLYSFCAQSGCSDGNGPVGPLVQATDGNFYGVTREGGTSGQYCDSPGLGCGTVFQITPSGTLTTLHRFCSQSGCRDGAFPSGGLIQASDGNLYGTTLGVPDFVATVFKITLSGKLTTLYTFCSQKDCADGYRPNGGLIQATDGNLYGTTTLGGAGYSSINPPAGYGTIFRITLGGKLTTLHRFCAQGTSTCSAGANPFTGLIQATDGDFYGTTGGYGAGESPYGTVFKMTPSGILTPLHSFCAEMGCPDGENPLPLLQAPNGNLYGTTQDGGTAGGFGTIFTMPTDFLLSVTPNERIVGRGVPADYNLTMAPLRFTGTVDLSCSGAPPWGSCVASPASVALEGTRSSHATVTVYTQKDTPLGTYTLTVTARFGKVQRSTRVTLKVEN